MSCFSIPRLPLRPCVERVVAVLVEDSPCQRASLAIYVRVRGPISLSDI